ncbi:MAG: elongation factor P [Pseudomonadota bacterium]
MKTSHVLILTAFAAVIAAAGPLIAQEGRPLRTMPHGVYQCALPGDADGLAFEVVEAEAFKIKPASRYSNAQGVGTYLMRGKELVFTRGPKKGEEFQRVGTNQLQRMKDDGSVGRLLCTRLSGTG